ncbi:MAG: thiolase family protein [Novosphingobium sp.]
MVEAAVGKVPPPSRDLSRRVGVIGVGETDYHADYAAERARAPGYEPPEVEDLCRTAFERALADSGLAREDIDGISCSFTYGGPPPAEMARLLGLKARYAIGNGNIMAGPLPVVAADIAAGKADCVAMIYSVASRAIGRQYGGATYAGTVGAAPSSYYYHLPWGWSSQAAHWALMFTHYRHEYGAREEDLAEVAIQVRQNASRYPNAVMQKPITVQDYMASRYIVRPLHLFDLCLVNDGAVCLIVSRAEPAKGMSPALVAGWGEAKVEGRKLHAMVRERLRPQIREAGRQALDMAGLSLADVGHFEGYDASTIHLVNQLEGLGFVEPGRGLAFAAEGGMGVGGKLPTNTAGGNLSGSYMHGWSQVAEAVRQVRGRAGPRQVARRDASLFSLAQTDQCHPLIFVPGE